SFLRPPLKIEDNQSLLRHFANGIMRTFTSNPARLYTSIGELVSSPSRSAVDDYSTDAQGSHGPECDIERICEDATLKAVWRGVDLHEKRIKVAIALDGDYGAKNLFADDAHCWIDVDQHRRFILCSGPMRADKRPGPVA